MIAHRERIDVANRRERGACSHAPEPKPPGLPKRSRRRWRRRQIRCCSRRTLDCSGSRVVIRSSRGWFIAIGCLLERKCCNGCDLSRRMGRFASVGTVRKLDRRPASCTIPPGLSSMPRAALAWDGASPHAHSSPHVFSAPPGRHRPPDAVLRDRLRGRGHRPGQIRRRLATADALPEGHARLEPGGDQRLPGGAGRAVGDQAVVWPDLRLSAAGGLPEAIVPAARRHRGHRWRSPGLAC